MTSVRPSVDLHVVSLRGEKTGGEGEAGHEPCEVGEGGEVEIADDAQGLRVLGVVDEDGVVGGNSVDHAIRKRERPRVDRRLGRRRRLSGLLGRRHGRVRKGKPVR